MPTLTERITQALGKEPETLTEKISQALGDEEEPRTALGKTINLIQTTKQQIQDPSIENTASAFIARSTPFSQSLDRSARRLGGSFVRGLTGLDVGLDKDVENPQGLDISDVASGTGTVGGFGIGLLPFGKVAQAGIKGSSLIANALRSAVTGGGFETAKTGARIIAGQEDREPLKIAKDIGGEAAFFGGSDLLLRGGFRGAKALRDAVFGEGGLRIGADVIRKAGGTPENVRRFVKRYRDDRAAGLGNEESIHNAILVSGIKNTDEILNRLFPNRRLNPKNFGTIKDIPKIEKGKPIEQSAADNLRDVNIAIGAKVEPEIIAGRSIDLFTDDKELMPLVRKLAREGLESGDPRTIAQIEAGASKLIENGQKLGRSLDDISLDISKRVGAVTDIDKSALNMVAEIKINEAWQGMKLFTDGKITLEQMELLELQALRAMRNAGFLSTNSARIMRVDREVGKGLRAKKAMTKELEKLAGGSEAKAQAYRRMGSVDADDPMAVAAFMRDMHTSKTGDKILEAWYSFILSSPKTQMVNLIGNTTVPALRAFTERPVAAGLDLIRVGANRAIGRQAVRERFFRESLDDLSGLMMGIPEGVRAGIKGYRTEIPLFNVTKLEGRGVRPLASGIQGKKGRVIRTSLRVLTFFDEFNKAVNGRVGLNISARRIARKEGLKSGTNGFNERVADLLRNPTDEMRAMEKKLALESTFQQELGSYGQKVTRLKTGEGSAEFITSLVAPFIRTPINITKFGLERTPMNFLWLGNQIRTGKLVGGEISDELAKATIGTGISLATLWGHQQGIITGGGPVDRSQRQTWLRENRPYAINIKRFNEVFGTDFQEQWLPYGRLEPISIVLGLTADYADLMQEGLIEPEDAVSKIGRALTFNLTNKTFLQGTSAFLDFIQNDPINGDKFVQMLAGSVVPNIIAEFARSTDPAQFRRVDSIEESIQSRIPILREELRPIRDIWGKPLLQVDVPGETGIENFVSPVRRSEIVDDPLTKEVSRLGVMSGLGSVTKQLTVQGKKLPLTPIEIDVLEEAMGVAAREAAEGVFNMPYYDRIDDEQRFKLLDKQIRKARDKVRKEMLRTILKGSSQ